MLALIALGVVALLVMNFIGSRVRWRLLRVLILVPLLTLFAFGGLFLRQYNQTQRAIEIANTPTEIIDATAVETGDLVVTVSTTGAVEPARQVPLAFALSGTVVDILVEAGSRVELGQPIARLDTSDLQRAVEDARVALDLQQTAFDSITSEPRDVDLAAAQAALDAARAQFAAAASNGATAIQEEIARLQTELARNRLWQVQMQRDAVPDAPPVPDDLEVPTTINLNGVQVDLTGVADGALVDALRDQANSQVSQAQQAAEQIRLQRDQAEGAILQASGGVDVADLQYQATQAQGPDYGGLASATSQRINAEIALDNLLNGPGEVTLEQTRIDLELARLSVEQAEATLDEATLTAPFDGLIASNELTIGELPPQGAAVILVDDSTFYVNLPVDETDVVKIRQGQRVSFDVAALPDRDITGVVERVSYTPQVLGQLVTYLVRVRLDETDAPIRVGMSVTGRIAVQELPDVLLLRNRFIRIDRTTQQAFVIVQSEGGRFEEIPVTLGERNATHSQIVAGLEAGQAVYLVPRDALS